MTKYKNYIVWLFIGLSFVVLFIRHLDRTASRHNDFQVYYVTAQRFVERADLYDRPDQSITPFKYSPVFAFLVSPLSLFSLKTAGAIFFIVSFISLGIVLVFSKKLIVNGDISFKENLWIYILPVILSFRFVLGVFDSGQVSFIIMALVVSGLTCFEKGKNILGGALFALSLMFKYMSFIFIPYFLIKRKYKAILFTILFAAFYCILPAVYTGWDKESDTLAHWLPSISQTSLDRGSWTDYKNQSLHSFILRSFMKDSPYQNIVHSFSLWSFHWTLIVSLILSALIYLFMILPRAGLVRPNAVEYALLFIGMALFSPNAWTFKYIRLIFVYMLLVYYLLKNDPHKHKWLLTLMTFAFVLTSGGSESLVGDKLQYQCEVLSTVTLGALILMFILFSLKFKKVRNIP